MSTLNIGGLISLRLQSITNPEAVTVLQDAVGRVNSMRILYDKLLLSENYEDISVKKYLDDLIDSIVRYFLKRQRLQLKSKSATFIWIRSGFFL